ncbi:hypothetical protein M406DRAFT_327209 [Cryphonectria parasitica EP155]|uniref:Uncharacterized protein n=1 Tax=Cryphonectria parasitica (strain ATCC 38755 / EP155) TaxID=660469 RepID=A0A9P4Y952_CRYP1|nr:uncharacterized protein M406DRAFT_327209 [Cryphonectria parasitica EP155]KAF3768788.1 hypothetical protein M406DRAFT_327209 [Cryphonectria parasitica EP155]
MSSKSQDHRRSGLARPDLLPEDNEYIAMACLTEKNAADQKHLSSLRSIQRTAQSFVRDGANATADLLLDIEELRRVIETRSRLHDEAAADLADAIAECGQRQELSGGRDLSALLRSYDFLVQRTIRRADELLKELETRVQALQSSYHPAGRHAQLLVKIKDAVVDVEISSTRTSKAELRRFTINGRYRETINVSTSSTFTIVNSSTRYPNASPLQQHPGTQLLKIPLKMCKCFFVEFVCNCIQADCPHHNPLHHSFHKMEAIWQVDHFKWKYCASFLTASGIPIPNGSTMFSEFDVLSVDKQPRLTRKPSTLKRLFPFRSDKGLSDSSQRASTTDRDHNTPPAIRSSTGHAMRQSLDVLEQSRHRGSQGRQYLPLRPSEDQRHGATIPVCEAISYEGWRIRRSCRWCEDYWLGRRGVV